MKVFVNPQDDKYAQSDFAINRESRALRQFAPKGIEIVEDQAKADLVVFYVHGFRRPTWWAVSRIMANNQKYAIVQLCLRSTPNPYTQDWLEIWENSQLVWSYYDLPKLCKEDGNQTNFNFYHAPLGVDNELFKETKHDREYGIAIHSRGWSKESLQDVAEAAKQTGKKVLNFNNAQKGAEDNVEFTGLINTGDPAADDRILASYYSRCEYVSGLRRIEGFEMPVIEGLLCGARPICFDLECYRSWFDGFAEFIPDGGSLTNATSIAAVLAKEPKPVTDAEKKHVKEKFNWQKIARGFWERV